MDNKYYLFAKEDIFDDNHQDILYLKDELIGSISVLKQTKEPHLLPRGVYYVKDEMNMHEIHIEEKVESWQYFENVLLLKRVICIDLNVVDRIRNIFLEDVHCGLFAAEDIYDKNDCLVYFKDDFIMDMKSSKNSICRVPLLNINEGTFYIQQIDVIEGYIGSTEQFYLHVNVDMGIVNFTITIENQPTMIEIHKLDEFNEFVEGAWLAIYDDHLLVDEWVSEKEHIVYNLTIGKKYVLKEKRTPENYIKSSDVFFVVENTSAVQKIKMVNRRKGSDCS